MHREEIHSGRKKHKRFEVKVGRKCCISRGGQMGQVEQWRYTSWKSPKRDTVLVGMRPPEKAVRTAPGVRAALSFESREGE